MAPHVARYLRIRPLVSGVRRETLLAQTGSITGTIVDARDGTPLEKVSVRVHDTKLATLTASDGRFQLDGVPAGRRELYVSSVDYILVRRFVDVPAGDVLVITIPIAAGTGTYAETVNVSGGSEEERSALSAGSPQQRAATASRRHHERSDARDPCAAGRRHRRRPAQRVQRARPAGAQHEFHVRRDRHSSARSHRARGPGHRLYCNGQWRRVERDWRSPRARTRSAMAITQARS